MRTGIIAASYTRSEPFVVQADNLSGFFNFQIHFIGTVKVDWGDGTSSKITSNSASVARVFSHTYISAYTGNIRIIGNNSSILRFTTRAEVPATGAIYINYSEFKKFKNLQYLNCIRSYDNLVGDIYEIDMPSLLDMRIKANGTLNENLVNLNYFQAVSGTLQQLPNELVSLESLFISNATTYLGSDIPETYTVLSTLSVTGGNTLQELPIIPALRVVDIRGMTGNQNQISSIPDGLPNLETIRIEGSNTVSSLPSAIESPNIRVIYIIGQNTIASIPNYTQLTSVEIRGNNSIGSIPGTCVNLNTLIVVSALSKIAEIPVELTNLTQISLTELLSNSIPNITTLNYLGLTKSYLTSFHPFPNMGGGLSLSNNTGLIYDIADWLGLSQLIGIKNTGGNVTYSGGKNWNNSMRQVVIDAGLNSTEIDLIIHELSLIDWNPTLAKLLDLRGSNAPRTSASDADVAALVSKNVTVLTN